MKKGCRDVFFLMLFSIMATHAQKQTDSKHLWRNEECTAPKRSTISMTSDVEGSPFEYVPKGEQQKLA